MDGAVCTVQSIQGSQCASRTQRQQRECDEGFEQDGAAREMSAKGEALARRQSAKWHWSVRVSADMRLLDRPTLGENRVLDCHVW
nr:hypothetical protein RSP597_11820 [Ralstonia solanacearum]